jgi:hypothetical protein
MGLNLARANRSIGDESSASITWLEYADALAAALDSAGGSWGGGDTLKPSGPISCEDALAPLANVSVDEYAARALESTLRHVRARARRSFGLVDALELQCEAARLRLLLIRHYARLGDANRVRALAWETHAVL